MNNNKRLHSTSCGEDNESFRNSLIYVTLPGVYPLYFGLDVFSTLFIYFHSTILHFLIVDNKSGYLRYPAKWTKGSFDIFCSYFWAEVSNKDMKMICWGRGLAKFSFISGFVIYGDFLPKYTDLYIYLLQEEEQKQKPSGKTSFQGSK